MTAHSKVQGNGLSAEFVFSSSKPSCLGLFAGDSITCGSHFIKCSQSWDTVAYLEHMQVVFLFWKSWRGPRWSPFSSLLWYLICASEPDFSCSNFFPLRISPASQRDEAYFAITEPSWCLPERGKIQHEMHPFAIMPCSYTDLSVLCSVLYLPHPSYITALSTCCSLKRRCQSLSGRASRSAQ